MTGAARIRRGQSCATDARRAARELHAAVAQPDMALVVFFCSRQYDLPALASELDHLFEGVPLVGCTTAGEIGPIGYRSRSLAGASFPAADFSAVSGGLTGLQQFSVGASHTLVADLTLALDRIAPAAEPENTFALLLVDGLSTREESVTHALHRALGRRQLVGGSAGDDLRLCKSFVYFDGCFHEDSAALALVSTRLPFWTFKTQHFVPTSERAVVTAADAGRRVVSEIDGWPAADAYARMIGTTVDGLDPDRFSAEPLVVVIDGTSYVRSIQKVNADRSLSFFCAVEEGIVLRRVRGVNLVEDLEQTLERVRAEVGPPQLVIGCDCILRRLEVAARGLVDRVETLFCENNVVGFNSYGEQFGGVHVNQTLTGIAIAERSDG